MQLTFLDVTDTAGFDAAYRIYEEALPKSERKPRAELASMLTRPDYQVRVLREQAQVRGLSVVWMDAGSELALLEYMAVEVGFRDHGRGAALYRDALTALRKLEPNYPLLVEIDSPDEVSDDQAQRARRCNFYLRLGCRRIPGLDYLLPIPGADAPPRMELMLDAPTLDTLTTAKIERWLKAIYVQVYGCRADDPRITQMLQAVVDPITLARRIR